MAAEDETRVATETEEVLAPLDEIEIAGGGFVRVMDVMGDDLRVVNAARVSMNKSHAVIGKGDKGLIKFLGRNGHWTPFSHPQVCLHIKMPISVARQWFKHMIGLTRNEVSRRYVKEAPEFYVPPEWRKGSKDIKQGSLPESVDDPEVITEEYSAFLRAAEDLYTSMIARGVCAEQARFCLPQAMFTEFWETGSLAAYGRLCSLRCKPDAQKETREFANAVHAMLGKWFPLSWAALSPSDEE